MANLKQCAVAFGLVASTALSGCASTSSTASEYQGSGSLYNPQENTAQHQQTQVAQGMIIRRDFSGLKAEFCDAKDQWVKTGNNKYEYCFDKADVKYVTDNNLVAGAQYQNQGPQYAKQMWQQLRQRTNRSIEGNMRGGNFQLGQNGKGGVNLANAMMNTDAYKRTCFDAFAFSNPNAKISGVITQSPAQLGTFDNCVSKARIATATHRMGGITIKIK